MHFHHNMKLDLAQESIKIWHYVVSHWELYDGEVLVEGVNWFILFNNVTAYLLLKAATI